MSAFVLHDAQGAARSIATGAPPSPAPAGLTAVVITDAEFAGLTSGTHRWNAITRAVEVDTVKAQATANQQSVRDFIATNMPTLLAVIDRPPLTFGNVAQAQTEVRKLQADVQNLARGMRRIARWVLDDYTGTD